MTPTSTTKCSDERLLNQTRPDPKRVTRYFYALDQDPVQPEGALVGWLYRFGSTEKRDEFVTQTKWRSRAIGSADLVVRHARGAGKWFGWPVRVYVPAGQPRTVSPYEASLSARRAS